MIIITYIRLQLILLTLLLYINKTIAPCPVAIAGWYCSSSVGSGTLTSCGAGYYCSGAATGQDSLTGRNPCSAGRWSSATTLSADSGCTACVAGKYNPATATAQSTDTCQNCANGYWSAAGRGSTCTDGCGAGYYCTGGTRTACSAGRWSSGTTLSADSGCTACVAEIGRASCRERV